MVLMRVSETVTLWSLRFRPRCNFIGIFIRTQSAAQTY